MARSRRHAALLLLLALGGLGAAAAAAAPLAAFSLASTLDSVRAALNGSAVYGYNCGVGVSNNTWIDDLDECCWHHDKCYERYRLGQSPGLQARRCATGGLVPELERWECLCPCDAALLQCVAGVRRAAAAAAAAPDCAALPGGSAERQECEAAAAKAQRKLEKGSDITLAFLVADACVDCWGQKGDA